MNLSTQSIIEFIVGLVGLISGAAGLSSYLTSQDIKHEISSESQRQKSELITVKRRVKLLELFAAKGGFLREMGSTGEDTDL